MNNDFWDNFIQFVSDARLMSDTFSLQLLIENLTKTSDLSNLPERNERCYLWKYYDNYYLAANIKSLTSTEIELMSNSDNKITPLSLCSTDVATICDLLETDNINDVVSHYQQDEEGVLKISVAEDHIFKDEHLIILMKILLEKSLPVDVNHIQSIDKVILPVFCCGSIEIKCIKRSNSSVSLSVCNSNGMIIAKVENIHFEELSLSSQLKASYLEATDFNYVGFFLPYFEIVGFSTKSFNEHETFIRMGMDSLQRTQLELLLMKEFPIEIGITSEYDTIFRLYCYIKSICNRHHSSPIEMNSTNSLKVNDKINYELSYQQIQFMILNELYSNERGQFLESFSVNFQQSQYSIKSLFHYINKLIMYHKILRIIYESSLNSMTERSYPFTILSGTECFLSPCIHQHLNDFDTNMNILTDIPLKIFLRNSDHNFKIYFNFHHVAIDSISISIFMKQLKYLLEKKNIKIGKQYYECNFEIKEKDKQYWEDNLTKFGDKSEKIISEFPRRNLQSSQGCRKIVEIPASFTEFIRKLREPSNCSDFSIFVSIYSLLIHKVALISDFCIGFPVSVRNEESQDIIGCFVNTLPLFISIDSSLTFHDFLLRISQQIHQIINHSTVPFRDLVKQSPGDRVELLPLFQVLLVQDNHSDSNNHDVSFVNHNFSKYEQTWYFGKSPENQYNIVIEYQTDLYSNQFITELSNKFIFILKNLSSHGIHRIISEISVISQYELEIDSNNSFKNKSDFPKSTVFENFIKEDQSVNSSIEYCNDKLSFIELKDKALSISQQLSQEYFQFHGEILAIERSIFLICNRNIELLQNIISSWMCGLTIIPISYDWPIDRIVDSVLQMKSCIVITDRSDLKDRLNEENVYVFSESESFTSVSSNQFNRLASSDLGYMTFTSGSTGIPKAVCTPLKGHSNLACEYTKKLFINSRSTIYQVVNYAFDIFFADLTKIWSNGSSCVLAAEQIPKLNELKKCSNAYIMPAYLSSISSEQLKCLKCLESIHFGGEPIQLNTLENLIEMNINIMQEYGLTEQTVFTSFRKLRKNDSVSDIGQPYHNLEMEVRDLNSNLLPRSFIGELYLKNMLCRGYFNNEIENRKKFGKLKNRFKTGDIVQYQQGKLNYLFRLDHKVKINGQIIDITDLQQFFTTFDEIKSCLIVSQETTGNKHLIAYIIPKMDNITENEIIIKAKERLPDYAVPKLIFFLKTFPLNANGKVDKSKLPLPLPATSNSKSDKETLNGIESFIGSLFKKYLNLSNVNRNSNFFTHGGDSLKALLMIQDLQKFGISVKLMDIMMHKTVGDISERIRNRSKHNEKVEKQDVKSEKCLAMSLSQQRIWFLQSLHTNSDAYTIKLELTLSGNLNVKKLEQVINQTKLNNFSLRQQFISCRGDLIVEQLSGTECFHSLGNEELILPSTRDTIQVNFERKDKSRYVLVIWFHHIIVDGRSIAILVDQLTNLYDGNSYNFENSFPKNNPEIDKKFWKLKCKTFANAIQGNFKEIVNEASYLIVCLQKYEKRLEIISNQIECSVFHILVAGIVHSIRNLMKTSAILTSVTVSNRESNNMNSIGFFAETLPIGFTEVFSSNIELIKYCKQEVLDMMNHSSDSLIDILNFLNIPSDAIRSCITYQSTSLEVIPKMNEIDVTVEMKLPQHTHFDISFIFFNSSQGLQLRIEYSKNIISSDSVAQFEQDFMSFLSNCKLKEEPLNHEISIDLEERILKFYCDILENADLTVDSNFFQNGGHSLLSIKLLYLIGEELNKDLPLKILFEHPTPRELSSFLQKSSNIFEEVKQYDNIIDVSNFIQPTINQKTLLKSFKNIENKFLYDISLEIKFLRCLEKNLLIQSINYIIMHHISLRLKFTKTKKNFEKVILSGTECYQNPWSNTENTDNSLFSIKYIKENSFILSLNHLISDGYSFHIILRDFQQVLSRNSLERDNLAEFHLWQSSQYEALKQVNTQFWDYQFSQFSNFTEYSPTFDRTLSTIELTIPKFHDSLKLLSAEWQSSMLTPFHVLMAIFANIFQNIYKRPMAIGFPVNFRQEKHQNIIDYAVHTSILLMKSTNNFKNDISYCSKVIIEAISHSFISYEDLLNISKNTHLYDIMIVFDNYSCYNNEFMTCKAYKSKYVKCPLTIFVDSHKDKLIIDYAQSLFSHQFINRILEKFQKTLQNCINNVTKHSQQADVSIKEEYYPLSSEQEQMFFLSQTKDKQNYVLPFIKKLNDSVEISKYHKKFLQIVQINQQFRTTFKQTKDGTRQVVLSMTETYFSPEIVQISNLKFFIENFHNTGCVTTSEPISCIFLNNNNQIFAYLALHHIVSDAWTTNLLEKDLNLESKLEKKNFTYIHYIQAKNNQKKIELLENHVSDLERCDELLICNLEPSHEIIKCQRTFGVEMLCSTSISPFTVFLKEFSILYEKRFNKTSINIGFPYINRPKCVQNVYGYFLNNLVINISSQHSLKKIGENVDRIMEENLPFTEIVKNCRMLKQIFEIYINFRYTLEEKFDNDVDLSDLPDVLQFPIEIDIDKYKNKYIMTIRTCIMNSQSLEEFADELLNQFSSKNDFNIIKPNSKILNPEVSKILEIAQKILKLDNIQQSDNFFELGGNSLSFIEFVDNLEYELSLEIVFEQIKKARNFHEITYLLFQNNKFLDRSTETTKTIRSSVSDYQNLSDFPHLTVYEILKKNAESYSDNTAFITCDEQSFKYKEITEKIQVISRKISQQFIEITGKPIRSDDVIPIISHNSFEVHILIQAVLLTGACYMPILDDLPMSRIAEIISRTSEIYVYLGTYRKDIKLKHISIEKSIKKENIRCWNKNVGYDLGYIINTSGTTGTPKGVCIQQESMAHMMNGSTKNFFVNSRDVVYQATLFVYDNSILESWMPFCNGGCLILGAHPTIPRQLTKLIFKYGITICLLFPALVSIFKDETFKTLQQLRYWIVGAEKLPGNLLTKAIDYGIHVIQNYGPTETTAYALTRLMRRNDNPQNLGKTIQNTTCTIDSEGILLLSGVGMMRGYLNNASSSSKLSFNQKIWYKTGDVVKQTEDGNIIFIGRRDLQVKIRGHRVELSDIESVLCRHSSISLCKAIWEESNQSLTVLCQTNLSSENILEFFKMHLPSYMTPTHVFCLKQFPLTPNLKIDVQAIKNMIEKNDTQKDILHILACHGFSNYEKSFLENGGSTLKALEILDACGNCCNIEDLLSDKPLKHLIEPSNTLNKPQFVSCTITKTEMISWWRQILLHTDFDEQSNFFFVGGNSMLLVNICHLINQKNKNIDVEDLLNNLKFEDMLKVCNIVKDIQIKKHITCVKTSSNVQKTIIFIHSLFAGCAIYRHLINILIKNGKHCRILCVEHPNTFSFVTKDRKYFVDLNSLAKAYYDDMSSKIEGNIILIGASMGGTLAVALSEYFQNPKIIMIDTTSRLEELQLLTFDEHKLSLQSYIDDTLNTDIMNSILVNSWDLIQMLRIHQLSFKSNMELYQLSIDGTDLSWKNWCPEIKVQQISGTHSSMLNAINSISIFEKLQHILT